MSINKIELLRMIESRCSKSNIDTSELIGLNSLLIYSKEIFIRNVDINEYVEKVFCINFLPYVIRSRTLLFARVAKEIYYLDEESKIIITQKMVEYFKKDLVEEGSTNINNKKNKKSPPNANENMKKWMRGLNKHE